MIIYGIHAVIGLLSHTPARIRQLFIQEGRKDARVEEIIQLAKKHGIKVQTLSRQALDDRAEKNIHQGVMVEVTALPTYSEADLPGLLDDVHGPIFLLILDGVQDPRNLGACLRSANAAGVHAVLVPKDKSATVTPLVYKAASGAAENTPLIQVTNVARVIRALKSRGIWIYGATDQAQSSIYEADLTVPMAWVLGGEGVGLRRLTQESCDQLFKIPMQGVVSSLNVSVAAGICLYETVRQRE